jgi:hypothetical protein
VKAAQERIAATAAYLQPRLLFLPPAGNGYRDRDLSGDFVIPSASPGYDLFGSSPVEAAQLFWYRWITGHQVSFILWRTVGDVIGRNRDDMPPHHELDLLATCVDGYSAMLLYSGTVPRDHYHSHTRVRMALQHPSFSGTWAPDYRPIRRLFHGRMPWQDGHTALDDAIARNRRMHDHIAEHLVPDGRSLLQASAGASTAGISHEKEDLYDNFFLTIRRPVSRTDVVAQLSSRIADVTADLERHGLYPDVDGTHFPVLAGPSAASPLATGVVRTLRRAALLMTNVRRPLAEVWR